MKILTFILAAFLLPGVTWLGDFKAATTEAATENKMILVNFSGSDWCGPCIRLRKEILESSAFENYAKDHLVLVRASWMQHR
jgi:thiol-disulfide isomerase/thioredoxin